jgi:NAD(P)-dependent dehydrogenase (short-subunit alcohol dehydrogenase family)
MILVTGAAGHVGRAVVCRVASLGHDLVGGYFCFEEGTRVIDNMILIL